MLGDGVDEHRRIAVTQAIQRLRYVDEHGVSVYQKGFSVLHNRERHYSKEHNESTQVSGAWRLALGAAACGSNTPTTPTPTTPVTVTDTFAGTLTAERRRAATRSRPRHPGTSRPRSPRSRRCDAHRRPRPRHVERRRVSDRPVETTTATQLSLRHRQASQRGTFCVRIYDVGNVTDPSTYELQVNHP